MSTPGRAHLYRLGVLTACLCLVHVFAWAQPLSAGGVARANQGPDLKFPEEAKELSVFSPLAMAIYKPTGAGPFPAVVIVHSCGGLRAEIQDWARLALERGYVVFVMDSLSQRNVKDGCSPATWVQPVRGAKDALQAREHLKRFAFVDQDRVALVGFSWGAMVGLYASSGAIASQLSSSRYAAVVSFYPICYFPGGRGFPAVEWLRAEIDKPLLVLMGDQDNEAPATECVSRLEKLSQKGVPVEWHVYPATTHCWDCSTLNNYSKADWLGNRVVYRYDRQVTQDSAERMFAFLAKRLTPGK
ncbi:MAG TPA: dienelactone hydrolase family protein [Burkholderiales bacterium]|nr:dienelactone hydrolase family protein [Burkholderiales bacterium]